MPATWAGFGKPPLTLIKEALADKFIQARDVDESVINYSVFVDVADEERDLTVGVLFRHNSLFFVVDLQLDCEDNPESIASVAEASFALYIREQPFYGRLLVHGNRIYYQLCHILGGSILDPPMASQLLELVQQEVLEIIGLNLNED